jgi:glycosyltransferase involved in cell wall biosynthesis
MMYISLFEGFGIPILEAAQCGVPSITSNVSSMPEVCGDSGILISDPENIQEVYEAMIRIITDKDLYQTLCARSTIQASRFSWDKTAQGLWNSIQQTI